MLGDVLRNIHKQRAGPNQQNALPTDHFQSELREKDPPTKYCNQRNEVAHNHDADRHPEIGTQIGEEALDEEANPDNQEELLQQNNARLYADSGEKVVEVKADNDSDNHGRNTLPAPVNEQEDGGVKGKNQVASQKERGDNQYQFAQQYRERP